MDRHTRGRAIFKPVYNILPCGHLCNAFINGRCIVCEVKHQVFSEHKPAVMEQSDRETDAGLARFKAEYIQ